MKTLKIQKIAYPLHFGNSFLRKIEIEGIKAEEIDKNIEKAPINTAFTLLQVALNEGARISGKEFNMSLDDLADACDADPDMMERFYKELGDAFKTDKTEKGKKE